MRWIIKVLVLGAVSWGAQALTEAELKHILRTEYGKGGTQEEGEEFARNAQNRWGVSIPQDLGVRLVSRSRLNNHPELAETVEKVLTIINHAQESGTSNRPPSPSGARGRSPSPARQGEKHWLEDTLLIQDEAGAVAGFKDIKNRLDVFNPLYGEAFTELSDLEKRIFPNAPLIHPYNGIASPQGVFFPLVVNIPTVFFSSLPERVHSGFKLEDDSKCELFWVVQDSNSLGAESIVFRPQYWFQPNGKSVKFSLDAHLLGPDDAVHNLGKVGYSIHDGVASPNAPVIPFQDKLRSEESHRFWSFVSGPRAALTCHWILGPQDIKIVKQQIQESPTMLELLNNLRCNKRLFSNPRMVEEIEEVFYPR